MFNSDFKIGKRYQDAQLSQIDFPPEVMVQLNEWVKHPKGMLIFIGNPGIGKTHFCAALYNYYINKVRVFYANESEFLRRIRNSINEAGGDYVDKTKSMANYDNVLWILDDIGSSQMTEWQKEVLLTFVDEMYKNRKPMVITSNIWTRDMDTIFSPRFRSRICATENVLIELNWEDKRLEGK